MLAFVEIIVMGGIGGLLVGRLLRRLSFGALSNFAAGMAGGGLSRQIWVMFVPSFERAVTAGPLAQLPDLIVAALGGGLFLCLLGFLRNVMAR